MKEIDPKTTSRAAAFELWMQAPMPMVTLFKTFDVSRIVKVSRQRNWKFNMLMCWCIGKAASTVDEFYMLPVGDKLMQFDRLAVNVVVNTQSGGISTCDIPFSEDVVQFNADYLRLTHKVSETGHPHDLGSDYMVIGTSAMTACELDGVVNIYSGIYTNPFLAWGKYRKRWLKAVLPVSFQFHHTQMDGAQAAHFLNVLQEVMKKPTDV